MITIIRQNPSFYGTATNVVTDLSVGTNSSDNAELDIPERGLIVCDTNTEIAGNQVIDYWKQGPSYAKGGNQELILRNLSSGGFFRRH